MAFIEIFTIQYNRSLTERQFDLLASSWHSEFNLSKFSAQEIEAACRQVCRNESYFPCLNTIFRYAEAVHTELVYDKQKREQAEQLAIEKNLQLAIEGQGAYPDGVEGEDFDFMNPPNEGPSGFTYEHLPSSIAEEPKNIYEKTRCRCLAMQKHIREDVTPYFISCIDMSAMDMGA